MNRCTHPIWYSDEKGEGNIEQKIQLYLEQGTEQPLPSVNEMSPQKRSSSGIQGYYNE